MGADLRACWSWLDSEGDDEAPQLIHAIQSRRIWDVVGPLLVGTVPEVPYSAIWLFIRLRRGDSLDTILVDFFFPLST